ncbi:MAG: CBS domain-containing protein, partial [Bacteroidetes bacterium]|nr:CBS domain-containing protein [Bacteroidota bacterium]
MQDYDPHATPDVEVAEVLDFLRAHAPFDALPEPMLRQAAHHLEIEYHRKGTTVLAIGDASTHLYMVRAGAVELHDDEGTLVARLGEGQYVGYPSLLTGQTLQRRVHTIEDTLLYRLPAATFDRLRSASDVFDAYFNRAHAERIRAALTERRTHRATLTVPIRTLLRRAPVCIAPDASIRAAAQRMRDERVSSLLIRTDDRLVGILTDRDLRTRVVAEGTDLDAPVATVMTEDPVTIPAQDYAFEALMTMSRRNVHHLPVVDGGALAGMVTTTDLMRLQAASPVYLI